MSREQFKISRFDNVISMQPLKSRGDESTYAAQRSASVLVRSVAALVHNCRVLTPDPASIPVSADSTGMLMEIQKRHERLQRELMSRFLDDVDERQSNLHRILQLTEAQMAYGRRDHARCEQFLQLTRVVRNRIEQHHLSARPNTAERDANLDRLMGQQLVGLMMQASARNPDESEYSLAWRDQLKACAEDLTKVIEAGTRGVPLEVAHPERHLMLTGQFRYVSCKTQLEVAHELRDRYGFKILGQRSSTVVCFSPELMQLALVNKRAIIRYIDLMGVVLFNEQLPDLNLPASADDMLPPSAVYCPCSGGIVRLTYNLVGVRYLLIQNSSKRG